MADWMELDQVAVTGAGDLAPDLAAALAQRGDEHCRRLTPVAQACGRDGMTAPGGRRRRSGRRRWPGRGPAQPQVTGDRVQHHGQLRTAAPAVRVVVVEVRVQPPGHRLQVQPDPQARLDAHDGVAGHGLQPHLPARRPVDADVPGRGLHGRVGGE